MRKYLLYFLLALPFVGFAQHNGPYPTTARMFAPQFTLYGPGNAPQTFPSWYIGPNHRYIFCGTNGNDQSAVASNSLYFATFWDYTNTTGKYAGAMGNATSGTDVVVLLSNEQTPVIDFKAPGTILNLNGFTLSCVTNTPNIPIGFPIWSTGDKSPQYYPFLFPFVFPNINCMIENGTLLQASPNISQGSPAYGLDGSRALIGFEVNPALWPTLNGGSFADGTNWFQIIGLGSTNFSGQGANYVTNFGLFTQYGITNPESTGNPLTNFVFNNVAIDQQTFDICVWNNYNIECNDPHGNDPGGKLGYFCQFLPPSHITFTNCTEFTYWDANIFIGINTVAEFDNVTLTRFLNQNSGLFTAAWGGAILSTNIINNCTLIENQSSVNLLKPFVLGLSAFQDLSPVTPDYPLMYTNYFLVNGLVDNTSMGNQTIVQTNAGSGGPYITTFGPGFVVQTNGTPFVLAL